MLLAKIPTDSYISPPDHYTTIELTDWNVAQLFVLFSTADTTQAVQAEET